MFGRVGLGPFRDFERPGTLPGHGDRSKPRSSAQSVVRADCVPLAELVRQCRDALAAADEGALENFEALLAATGFRWEDDYTDTRWSVGSARIFRVDADFPALPASICPPGVSHLRYSIDLALCAPYEVDIETVLSAIEGHTA